MPEIQPPHYLQNACHTAQGDRQVISSIVCGEGVAFGANSGGNLEVVDGPGGMQVTVSSGNGFVQGDDGVWQGMYHVTNDDNVDLTLSASDPTNDRIDLIVAQVHDNAYAVPGDDWVLEVVTGTPAGSPVAPTVPDSAIALAQIAVAAGAVAITAGDITDRREPYTLCQISLREIVVLDEGDPGFSKADYPGAQRLRVIAIGDGGGGGGSEATGAGESAVATGGSGGTTAIAVLDVADLADTESISVGTGGNGGSGGAGSDGDGTSFGSWVVAPGGLGGSEGTAGASADATPGADAAVGGTGDIIIPGSATAASFRSSTPAGSFASNGGDSMYGSGGRGKTLDGVGVDGTGYGGGGGGAKTGESSSAKVGGDGAPGAIIVEIYG